MALIEVLNPLTTAQIAAINVNLGAIKGILDVAAIAATKSQVKSMIKVSRKRVALIKDVDIKVIKQYPEVVPDSISIADFESDMKYRVKLQSLIGMLNAQLNCVTFLLKVTSNNQMVETTMILDCARVVAENNIGLRTMMNDIASDHFNSQPGKNKPTSHYLPVGVTVTLSGVLTGRIFTNAGSGILSLLKVNGNIADTIQVYPFSGIKIPKGWVNVVVTNLSETAEASFNVYLKKQKS